MRVNCHVPDRLAERVKERLPDLNVSQVLQTALQGLLGCEHERMACGDCGEPMSTEAVGELAMEALYRELLHAWGPLVDKGGTAEGAARLAKTVAVEMGVPGAERRPLPRPPRRSAMRHAS